MTHHTKQDLGCLGLIVGVIFLLSMLWFYGYITGKRIGELRSIEVRDR